MNRTTFVKIFLFSLLTSFGLPAFSQEKGANTANPVKILFLGDSLTEGYQVPKNKTFPALIEAKLQSTFPGLSVINGGVSGSTTASGMSRLKWHLRSKVKPSVVVLALGANDGLRGQPVSNVKKNLVEIVRYAKERKMKVLLAGMKIPPNYGQEYAAGFESVFPDIAKEHKVQLIPFLLEGVAAIPDLNLPDGIHPNEKGYVIVAETVLKYLTPMLKE